MDRDTINYYLIQTLTENALKYNRYLGVPAPVRKKDLEGISNAVTKRLTVKEAHREIKLRNNDPNIDTFQIVKAALIQCGKVIEEDDFKGIVAGMIFAGINEMDPAVLVIEIKQDDLEISAYAKEGVIKQNTAEKAIDKYVKCL